MNRRDLSRAVAARTGLPVVHVDACVRAVCDVVAGEVAAGRRVTVSGFGAFVAARRAARVGRDVRRGGPVPIPARTVAVFEASPKLNAYIDSGVKQSGSITGRAPSKRESTE